MSGTTKTPQAKEQKHPRVGAGCPTKTIGRALIRDMDHPSFNSKGGYSSDSTYRGLWTLHARLVVDECEPAKMRPFAQHIVDTMSVEHLVRYWAGNWYVTVGDRAASGDILLDMVEACVLSELHDRLYPERGGDHMFIKLKYESPDFHTWRAADDAAEKAGFPRPDPQDPMLKLKQP